MITIHVCSTLKTFRWCLYPLWLSIKIIISCWHQRMQNEIWNRIYESKSLPSFFNIKSHWILYMKMGVHHWIHNVSIIFLQQKVILITWFWIYLLKLKYGISSFFKSMISNILLQCSLIRIQKCVNYSNSDLGKHSGLQGFKTPQNII